MAKTQSTFPTTIDDTLQSDRASGGTITSDSYDILEDAIFELETKIGVDSSDVVTSVDYQLSTRLSATNVYATTVTATNITAANVVATQLTGTTIIATNLTGTNIHGTTITGTTIRGTTVYGNTVSGDIKTIVFDIPGTAAIGTNRTTSFIVPFACTITKAYLYQRTASTGATTLTVDINKSGTTIWSTQSQRLSAVTAVATASTTTFGTTSLTETDRLDIDFDAVGTTIVAKDVTVELKVVT